MQLEFLFFFTFPTKMSLTGDGKEIFYGNGLIPKSDLKWSPVQIDTQQISEHLGINSEQWNKKSTNIIEQSLQQLIVFLLCPTNVLPQGMEFTLTGQSSGGASSKQCYLSVLIKHSSSLVFLNLSVFWCKFLLSFITWLFFFSEIIIFIINW